eukprot:gene4515-3224_t
MDDHHGPSHISDALRHQIVAAISKPSGIRTYDDLLLLKSYMLETEFFEKSQLGNANPRQVNDLCRGIELEVRKVGEVVFNQGDIGDKVYIILFGKVEFIARFTIDLTQGQTEIREKKLDTFASGRIFGERALQFDEPRSATAQCVEDTYLITVEKGVYLRVLEDVRTDRTVNFRPDQLKADQVTRETVLAILSKKREKRTHQELEAAALYLCNRTKVESFQKLSMAQVVEVCRVAETLTIWGKSMVCKQGEVGPVFYAVLGGSVEVWVSKETPAQMQVRTGSKHHDITEGLGRMENQLVTGKTFGDRALTAMDSLRKASIVTCEDVTELLVIFRKDYENLIAATSQVETMAKIRLLRKTDLFHNLDMIHLRALANVMETKTYGIDETVVMVGKRATDVIIVERGEMTVLTEVLEGYSKDKYQRMVEEQSYHHYLEDKHHHSHLTSDGRPMVDEEDYNHDKLKKMQVKKNEILEMSKMDSQKYMQSKLQRMPSSIGGTGSSSRDLNANSSSTLGSQPFEAAVRESGSPNGGRRSAEERKRNPRFQSTQLVPIGRRKKVTLGRIAPNSVLATYVMTCATQHDEVYHPETIIATTLVNVYTVSKHAFFTSLPKDSKFAIVKLVKEYKPPILTSLWENVPRVLDETQWKMEKTWKNFKSRFMEHGHKANILDSHRRMENVHISVNSGNDPEVKLMPRHYQFMNQNKDHGAAVAMAILDPTKKKHDVTMDWGLPSQRRDSHANSPMAAAAATAVSEFTATLQANANEAMGISAKSSPASSQSQSHHHPHHHHPHHHHHKDETSAVIMAPTLAGSVSAPQLQYPADASAGMTVSRPEPLVSFRIRERLNMSRSMNALSDKQASALTASHSETALLRNSGQLTNGDGRLSPSRMSGTGAASSGQHHGSTRKVKALEMPFTLIQVHREWSKRNAINLASTTRRPLRSYLRICGSFPSCAKAKDMADLQMEQHYLQLFHSEARKEEELLLNWQTFNGFDSMALDATDHFLIYCRSTPVEFASLRPTKNIFNVRFPAICKPQSQRYAILVANPLPPSPVEQIKRAQQQLQEENGDENNDSSEDEATGAGAHGTRTGRRAGGRKLPMKALGLSAAAALSLTPGTTTTGAANVMGASFSTAASNSTNNTASATWGYDKDGKPMHLSELSVIYETLAITTTRMEGLRYAIEHFGRVIPARTTVSINGVGHRLPGVVTSGAAGGGGGGSMSASAATEASTALAALSSGATTATTTASTLAATLGGVMSEEDAALHAAIMSTPHEQLDAQQQQLQEMLLTTFVASQQLLLHQNDAASSSSAAAAHATTRTHHEHEQSHSHAAIAAKKRLGNHSLFVSPETPAATHLRTLSNDPNIAQSMALGALTVILKPLPSAGGGSGGAWAANGSDAAGSIPTTTTTATTTGGTATGDRILRLLHTSAQLHPSQPSQRLRVCVLPLFRWILIDGPTLDILDFTKAFHEDAIKNIFLAEQEEYTQQRQQLAMTPHGQLMSGENSRVASRQGGGSGGMRRPGSQPMGGQHRPGAQGYGFGPESSMLGLPDGDDADDADGYPGGNGGAEVFEYHGGGAGGGHGGHPHVGHAAWVHEVNQYRDFTRELLDNRELPPQLLASMSAAGLLPKKTAKAVAVRFANEQTTQHHHHHQHSHHHRHGGHHGQTKQHNNLSQRFSNTTSRPSTSSASSSSSVASSGSSAAMRMVHGHGRYEDAGGHGGAVAAAAGGGGGSGGLSALEVQQLQVLQQDMASQEIAQQLHTLTAKQAATLSPNQLIETDPLINSLIDPTVADDHNSVYHVTGGGTRMSAIDKEIAVTNQQLAQTMSQLQATIAVTGSALQVHDKLCDLEYATHNRFGASQSAVAQQKSLEMLNRRMDVIEGFQKLAVAPSQPPPVTLFTLYQQQAASGSGGGAGGGSGEKNAAAAAAAAARRPQRGLISAKYLNGGNGSGGGGGTGGVGIAAGGGGSTLGGNVNVAKRLNDTLKVLSESIDGPYRKLHQELVKAKEADVAAHEKSHRGGGGGGGGGGGNKFAMAAAALANPSNTATAAAAADAAGSTAAASPAVPPVSLQAAATAVLATVYGSHAAAGQSHSNSASNSVVSGSNSIASLSKQVSQSSLAASIG